MHIINYPFNDVYYVNPISDCMCLGYTHHVDYAHHRVVAFQRVLLTGDKIEYYTSGAPFGVPFVAVPGFAGYDLDFVTNLHKFILRYRQCPFTCLRHIGSKNESDDGFGVYGDLIEHSVHVATVHELIIFVKNLIKRIKSSN